jgi:hypothetical protein
VDSGEPLCHSSKFPGPSLLRDWLEDDDDEEAGDSLAGAKRKAQPACSELADKRKKPESAARDLRHPKVKKVAKRRAIAVAG